MLLFTKYIPLVARQTIVKMSTPCELDVAFNREEYFKNLGDSVKKILQRPAKDVLAYDILDTDKSKVNKLLALKEKQRQMKIGEIWQNAIGNYKDCQDLKVGHVTGLDILSDKRKFIAELKNRTNTDNASSKKTNFDKLAQFKIEHPEYTCIYANINDDTEEKSLQSIIKKFHHNGIRTSCRRSVS